MHLFDRVPYPITTIPYFIASIAVLIAVFRDWPAEKSARSIRELVVNNLILWIRLAFGGHTLLSGINYFYEVVPAAPITLSPSWPFVMEMMNVGMYGFIKVVEIITGICLMTNRFVPLALILEFPVTVSIFYLNVFVDGQPRPLYTGIRELLYHVFMMAVYGSYYLQFLRFRASPAPIWSHSLSSLMAHVKDDKQP